eukprot:s567_g12.t2
MDWALEDKAYKQGLGMALETRRIDKVTEFIMKSENLSEMLEYAQLSAMTLLTSKAFRERALVEIHISVKDVNLSALAQCYFILGEPEEAMKFDSRMDIHATSMGHPFASTGGQDPEGSSGAWGEGPVDNESQHFCNALLSSPLLKIKEPAPPPAPAVEGAEAPEAPAEPVPEGPEMSEQEKEDLTLLRKILSGRSSIDLQMEFLYRNNRSDLLLLDTIKNSIDAKNSITHNATVMAHGLMQCGTTSDVFLRKNLEWLAKASNWAKFSATASLGVIHKGHIKESRSILSTYLPQQGGTRGSPYSEGGALYGMGLIHANHYDQDTKAYLLEQLHNAQATEVLQHGACLGIGLLCMATADERIYDELTQTLYTDTAVAGEAAAYAIGLVMVGSASQKAIDEPISYPCHHICVFVSIVTARKHAASAASELQAVRFHGAVVCKTAERYSCTTDVTCPQRQCLGAVRGFTLPRPCADSVVPSVSEDSYGDGGDVSACTFKIFQAFRSTCFQLLKSLKASTDSLGYMPDGPWASCLEQAVKYEEKNKVWMLDPRFLSRKTTPQGPAGQVVELFAERVVETQIHLEDCLQSIEARQDSPLQRVEKLASSLQELMLSRKTLRAYAHDTQHEKIIRACALALAMMMFRKEEEAEPLIQEMLLDKDAILRYGGCFAIALAYVGTSQNAAIRKLLHISVSDVSDDVRRAAVMAPLP